MAKTKFTEDDMYSHVKNALRAKHKASDDWEIHGPNDKRKEGYSPDFVLEKKRTFIFLSDRIEKIIVEVKAEARIRVAHIDQLNNYARNHAGKGVKILKKILAIPSGADIESVRALVVRENIELMWVKSFQR